MANDTYKFGLGSLVHVVAYELALFLHLGQLFLRGWVGCQLINLGKNQRRYFGEDITKTFAVGGLELVSKASQRAGTTTARGLRD